MAADDPFGMFDDDENEDEHMDTSEASQISRSLVEKANQRSETTNVSKKVGPDPTETCSVDLSTLVELDLPWRSPLYLLSDVRLVSSLPFGGGRGYVALRAIQPGTLLLVEQPVITWPPEQIGKELGFVSIKHIFESSTIIVHELEHFHPTKQVVDTNGEGEDSLQVDNMIQYLSSKHANSPELNDLLDLAVQIGLVNSDGSPISRKDIIRILLALRYNGLESGIYLHVAMLNHAEQPNCVKFLPNEDKSYSEVRATRLIQPGEALTISYVPPPHIVSHASRRKHLFDQHKFDIGPEPLLLKMELIGGNLPVSTIDKWDDASITHNIETTVAELRLMYSDSENTPTHLFSEEASEKVKALEQASLELCSQAKEQLKNDTHLLLIPCLELHLDAASLVQRDPTLSPSQRTMLLGRAILTAHKLLELQAAYHGADHFALARTNNDLAQATEELLSKSPKHLLELKVEGLGTITAWSAHENKARREYSRIKALYPHDVENFVATTS
jgi:hypothetical protein